MIPDLHVERWLVGFYGSQLELLEIAIRRKHGMTPWWELADTEPGTDP